MFADLSYCRSSVFTVIVVVLIVVIVVLLCLLICLLMYLVMLHKYSFDWDTVKRASGGRFRLLLGMPSISIVFEITLNLWFGIKNSLFSNCSSLELKNK